MAQDITQNSRNADSRKRPERPKIWKDPSSLDAPEAPPGKAYRWVRRMLRGEDDAKNMIGYARNQFTPVAASDHPEFETQTLETGHHSGAVISGDLILMQAPKEILESREKQMRQKANSQLEAASANFKRKNGRNSRTSVEIERTTMSSGKIMRKASFEE